MNEASDHFDSENPWNQAVYRKEIIVFFVKMQSNLSLQLCCWKTSNRWNLQLYVSFRQHFLLYKTIKIENDGLSKTIWVRFWNFCCRRWSLLSFFATWTITKGRKKFTETKTSRMILCISNLRKNGKLLIIIRFLYFVIRTHHQVTKLYVYTFLDFIE